MSQKRASSNYAHRLLHTLERHNKRVNDMPHPVDQGEITKVGDSPDDIVIDLYNSTVNLDGDEVQWMIDEDRLEVGDVVTVVFDKAGDPVVVAAVFQADLTQEAALASALTPYPGGAHIHRTEVHVPTAPQATYRVGTAFDGVKVHASGLLLAPTLHYAVQSPWVVLNTPALASTIVQLELRIDK